MLKKINLAPIRHLQHTSHIMFVHRIYCSSLRMLAGVSAGCNRHFRRATYKHKTLKVAFYCRIIARTSKCGDRYSMTDSAKKVYQKCIDKQLLGMSAKQACSFGRLLQSYIIADAVLRFIYVWHICHNILSLEKHIFANV